MTTHSAAPATWQAQQFVVYPRWRFAQSSETLVTTSAALPADRLINPSLSGHLGGSVGLLSVKAPLPVSLKPAVYSAIPTYIEVYWERTQSLYPFIHKPTFEDATDYHPEQFDVLRCAMAAVASQYIDGKEARIIGSELHAYAWHKTQMVSLAPTAQASSMLWANSLAQLGQSNHWALPIMQAVLLCEYYARFRGRHKGAHVASPQFISLYQMVSWCFLANSLFPYSSLDTVVALGRGLSLLFGIQHISWPACSTEPIGCRLPNILYTARIRPQHYSTLDNVGGCRVSSPDS